MTAINQSFSMCAGDTKNLVVPVTKDDGSNVDLSGCSVKYALKKKDSFTDGIVEKQTPEITLSGNEITIKLLPNDTKGFTGMYKQECVITDQQGNISTVFTGIVTFIRE